MAKPVMHTFIVDTGSLPTLDAHRIEAAYYRTENGFTTFKDADNQAVYTVRDDHLVSIERVNDRTPIADLRRLLDEADRSDGQVEGTFTTRHTDPDGRVHETLYQVHVRAVQGSVEDLETPAPQQVTVNVVGSAPDEPTLRKAIERQAQRTRSARV